MGSEAYNLDLARLRADNTRQAIEDILGDRMAGAIKIQALGEAESRAGR